MASFEWQASNADGSCGEATQLKSRFPRESLADLMRIKSTMRTISQYQRLMTLLGLCWFLLGCSSWRDMPVDTFELPSVRLAPDGFALQVTFVRLPTGEQDFDTELWKEIDEQAVDQEMRQRLNENGFRCGLVGAQLPDALRALLDKKEQNSTLEATSQREIDSLSQNRQINTRSGKRSEIVTGALQDQMIVLYRDANKNKVIGKTFEQAQPIMATKCYASGDGGVEIYLIPEIQFGQPKKQWIAGDGTFHLLSARDREVYSELEIKAALVAGQTLVISSTAESKGVGHNFFVDTAHGDPQQKLLLVRLAQTQRDDLFESEPLLPLEQLNADETDGEVADQL